LPYPIEELAMGMMKRGCVLGGLILLAAGLAGCASYFKRKDCEKTNWYQHGYDVAMAGQRLDADDFLKQCQKVEAQISFTDADTGFKAGMAKYCTSDNVFNVGKAGKPFSYDMCDGENEKKMRARYTEGLRVFCVPDNGYHFGAGGGVYQDVCPKEMEAAWLVQYRKGRKTYLTNMIAEKEQEQQRLNVQISGLQNQRASLSVQQSSYLNQTTIRRERVYDAATGTYREQVTQAPDESAKMRSQEIANEISNIDYQIQRTRQQQDTLSGELTKMRTEMVSL
jgi:hypothetical protein